MDLARALQPAVYVLAPVLIVQGLQLRRRIPRLDEAAGPAGTAPGTSPPVRLAVLGDSTAAGVGTGSHEDALAGTLAADVAARTGRAVSWRAVARSGATSQTARDLVPGLVDGDWRPDLVVVCIGVNDLKGLRPLRAWDRDVAALLAAIGETTGGAAVIVTGMAPVSRFPALPQPLRAVMALRAIAMDHALHRLAGSRHVQVDPSIVDGTFFAEDGFHPSGPGYRAWASHLAGPAAEALAASGRQAPEEPADQTT
jgi:lysophospholipase L1-like esterase